MKKISLLCFALCCCSIFTCQAQFERHVKSRIYRDGNPRGFAVVELYTSEGCSSCPRAEGLMTFLQEMYRDRLYVLQFHVDYWNRQGWVDSFSNPAYTARQRNYVQVLKSGVTYTPQAVVNGKTHATGSDKLILKRTIEAELEKQPDSTIDITVKAKGENAVTVKYSAGLAEGEVVNIALVQMAATTNVTRGENAGEKLEHESIVRHFETLRDRSGKITIPLPPGIEAKQCRVMAFIQNSSNMHIMAVIDSSIPE